MVNGWNGVTKTLIQHIRMYIKSYGLSLYIFAMIPIKGTKQVIQITPRHKAAVLHNEYVFTMKYPGMSYA